MQRFYCLWLGEIRQTWPVSGLETHPGGSEKLPLPPPQTALSRKYLRDREHFRGYPVSKIIGDAGHWVSKPVSVSRALRGNIGFLAALFQPLERVAATGNRAFPGANLAGAKYASDAVRWEDF